MREHGSSVLKTYSVPGSVSWLVVLAVVAGLASTMPALFAQADVHAALTAPANRKPAPVFHLLDETGRTAGPSDYRGQVVLLNFWATECGGCVLEIPSIVEIQTAYRGKPFTVVGVSMDIPYEGLKDAKEAWDKVKPFIAKSKLNYPILMGNESLFKVFGLTEMPDTILIDKRGRMAALYVGLIDKGKAEADINQLLSER